MTQSARHAMWDDTAAANADPLTVVNLKRLVAAARPLRRVRIGLLDGPVEDSALGSVRPTQLPGAGSADPSQTGGAAREHGTMVAALLAAGADSVRPGLYPDCHLVVRPIFSDLLDATPESSPEDLAVALLDCLDAGVDVINLSAALIGTVTGHVHALREALDATMRAGVLVVAAAGNEGQRMSGTTITAHPWVLPVVAFSREGRPMPYSTLSPSVGRRGLGAPGERLPSIGADGVPADFSGTSAAAPLVTGAAALIMSVLPAVSAASLRHALLGQRRRTSVVPPMLDAWAAFIRSGGVE